MAVIYILAGSNHFLHPEIYLRIMPAVLPAHQLLVIVSGVVEILLGILLLFPNCRRFAAIGIIALLVAVFPANIQMLLNYRQEHHPLLWLAVLRLPVQGFLIWWAFRYTRPMETKDKISTEG